MPELFQNDRGSFEPSDAAHLGVPDGRGLSCKYGLIGSGASACLRPKLEGEDLSALKRHEENLASGSAMLWVNSLGTLITDQETEPIVSLRQLIELGRRLD